MMDEQIETARQYRLKYLYTLQSSYYARLGEYAPAHLYQDSALIASSQYEQLTGQHFILLGQQQLQEAELQLKSQQIAQQRSIIFIVLIVLAAVCGALFAILRLYRKKQAAYRSLARKAEEWASAENRPAGSKANADGGAKEPPTREDRRIMTLAESEMIKNGAFREPELTLDTLADRLGVRRNALSRAVNRTTDGNFNNYINSFRIREAVRMISETDRSQLYIEQIYECVGFGNRTSFYRAFKQFTGLSPADFQKNRGNAFRRA